MTKFDIKLLYKTFTKLPKLSKRLAFITCIVFTSYFYSSAQTAMDSLWIQVKKLSKEEQFLPANLILERLQEYYIEQNDWDNFLKAKIQLAVNFQQSDEDEAVISLLQEAIAIFNKNNHSKANANLALAYHKLGVSYYNLFQEKQSIAAYLEALNIRQKLYSETHPDIAKSLYNIGISHLESKNYSQAEQYLNQSLAAYQELGLTDRIGANYQYLGQVYELLDDIQKAKSFLIAAQNHYQTFNQDEPWVLPGIYNDLASLAMRQDSFQAVVNYAESALGVLHALSEKYDEDFYNTANAYNNLGLGYEGLQKFNKALHAQQESLAINQKFAKERVHNIADNYINIGLLYLTQKNYTKTQDYFNKALAIEQDLQRPVELSAVYNNLGNLALQTNQLDTALQYIQRAIQYAVPDFKPKGLNDNPEVQKGLIGSYRRLMSAFNLKTQVYLKKQEQEQQNNWLEHALATFKVSSQLIDRYRFQVNTDESKSYLQTQAIPLFANAIHTATTLFERTQEEKYAALAFEFSERSKALILLEAVNDNKAKSLAGIPLTLREEERSLNQKNTYFSQELFTLRNTKEQDLNLINSLNDSLLANNLALDKFIKKIEADYPQYYQLKYAFHPISIQDIQKKILHSEQAMVEYFVGETHIYIFKITAQKVAIHTIKNDFPLTDWIGDLRYSITANFSGERIDFQHVDSIYTNRAFQLYKKLWLPLLNDKEALPSEIIIVPDGILGYIPFAALLSQKVDKTQVSNYFNYPFLVKSQQISYTYSATLLQELQRPLMAVAKLELLAFAPTFGKTALRLAANDRSGLSPLLHNQREVKTVTELFGGQAFFGADASREQFIKDAPQYRYLHLSSHARMNDKNPEYSYISFTQTEDNTLDQTALLYVDDLYNIPLKADMVVLSACETALGKLNKGEGIISLARAFSYAGARSIITTLWRVNDQKSADLIIGFYDQLINEGQSKDAALRATQLAFIEEGTAAHPYYWAGFVGIGDMGKIEHEGFKWWWVLGGGMLLILGLFFRLKNRSSN